MAEEYIRRIHITGPETEETIDLAEGTTIIGRQSGNPIRLNSPMVSRQHAQIECSAAACQVTDLGSANGTSLNGQPLEANAPAQIKGGDKIQIGPFELVFEEIAIEPAKPEPPPKPKAKPKPKPKAKPKPEPEPPPPPPAEKPPSLPPLPPVEEVPEFDYSKPPPGLSKIDSYYLKYLPPIYHTDFMARFLALFESILRPIEWYTDNFDLYLHPGTAPVGFLPWLAEWFFVVFDASWTEEQQRTLLIEAHKIYARRGTRWALARVLEIYLGVAPEILDLEEDEDPFTFKVKLPVAEKEINRDLIEKIVDASKPAHTNYSLLFKSTSTRATKKA